MARSIGILSATTSQLTGTIFMLCVIASIVSVVMFACGHKSMKKKKNPNNRQRPDVTYYGTTGGAYASDYYGGGRGAVKAKNNNGLHVAAGVGAGLATAVVLDAALSGGDGGGCGGGGCGGGGCGGGGCGGGGCGS